MSYKKNRVKKGFTLIEVIIAVSIVVILASLTVPKVSGYIDKAKNAKVLNTAKQIYTAAMWSYSDQGNTFDEAKISKAINDTVGIIGITSTSVTKDDSKVTIAFSTDSVPCSIVITTADNSYKVLKKDSDISGTN